MSQGNQINRDTVRCVAESFVNKYGIDYRNYPVHITGSYRRERPMCSDIDLVFEVPVFKIAGFREQLKEIWGIQKTQDEPIMKGTYKNVTIDMHTAYPADVGAMMLHTTGPWFFNKAMRIKAKQRGLKLNQYGLWERDRLIASEDEDDIFRALGISYIMPQKRDYAQV